MERDSSNFHVERINYKMKPPTVSSSGIISYGDYYIVDSYHNPRYNCYRCGAPVKPQQHDCEYCGRNIHEN